MEDDHETWECPLVDNVNRTGVSTAAPYSASKSNVQRQNEGKIRANKRPETALGHSV